jgi:Flp pilus assembly protein TadG
MARNLFKTQKGITMVELAIILPILLLVLFAIMELAIALYDKAVLTNASREGARAGIVAQDPRVSDDTIRKVVRDYAAAHLITFGADILQADEDHIVIERTDNDGNGKVIDFGDDLKVSVNYRFDFLVLSRLISALGADITLNATTVMKYE